jgi:hypothetical protein
MLNTEQKIFVTISFFRNGGDPSFFDKLASASRAFRHRLQRCIDIEGRQVEMAGFMGKLACCPLQSWQSADYTIESIRPAEAKNCHF